MRSSLLKLVFRMQNLIRREEAQDLVEYALVVALIAFATTASTSAVGKGLSSAFTKISSTLSSSY